MVSQRVADRTAELVDSDSAENAAWASWQPWGASSWGAGAGAHTGLGWETGGNRWKQDSWKGADTPWGQRREVSTPNRRPPATIHSFAMSPTPLRADAGVFEAPKKLDFGSIEDDGVTLVMTRAGRRPKISAPGMIREALELRRVSGVDIPWGERETNWDGSEIKRTASKDNVHLPKFDGLDPGRYPAFRKAVIRWATLTGTSLEGQGETILTGVTETASLALQGYEPGDLYGHEGLGIVLATLDENFWKEADSDVFEKYEAAIFGDPRRAKESLMQYTLRLSAAHSELLKKKPYAMDDGLRGYLLMRGAGLGKHQRDQVLLKTNYEYSWQAFAPLSKRMSEDRGSGNQASAMVASSSSDRHFESGETLELDPDEGEELEREIVQAMVASAIDDMMDEFALDELQDQVERFEDDGVCF